MRPKSAVVSQALTYILDLDCSSVGSSEDFLDASEDEISNVAITATHLSSLSTDTSPRYPSDLKTHQCNFPDCKKVFNRPAKLAQHIRSHTNERPFACPHSPCTKDFLRQSHLKHHIKSAHSSVRDYICKWDGCGKSFITSTRLKRHYAVHEGREKFKCTVEDCGQTFRKHGTLQKHVTTVHEGKKPFRCQLEDDEGGLCDEGFDTAGKLHTHQGRVHGGQRFWCTICTPCSQESGLPIQGPQLSSFPTYSELQEHIKLDHPPTCTECGLRCSSQRELKNHIDVRHGALDVDERRTYICAEPDCARAFTKKGNLNIHIQSVHREKKFVCGGVELSALNNVGNWNGNGACGRGLSTKGNLEEHIRTAHMGLGRSRKKAMKEQPGPGEKQGNEISVLTRLTGAGYKEESGRDIQCWVAGCDFRFSRKCDFERHLASRHAIAEQDLKDEMEIDEDAPYREMANDLASQNSFERTFAANGCSGAKDRRYVGEWWDNEWLEDEMRLIARDGMESEGHAQDAILIDPFLA